MGKGKVLQPSPNGRKYGHIWTPPRVSDIGIAHMPVKVRALPPRTNFRIYRGPTKNQSSQGSCDGHASTSRDERLYRQLAAGLFGPLNAALPLPPAEFILSPAYTYAMERVFDGDFEDGDTGATIQAACGTPPQYGALLATEMPYDPVSYSVMPTNAQIATAQTRRPFIGWGYHTISTVYDLKVVLAEGYPVVFGFNVYDSFEGEQVAETGLMPMPNLAEETLLGGHAQVAHDYDDDIQCPGASSPGALYVQNSWGTGWGLKTDGDQGCYWFPYEAVLSLITDMRVQHIGPPWGAHLSKAV